MLDSKEMRLLVGKNVGKKVGPHHRHDMSEDPNIHSPPPCRALGEIFRASVGRALTNHSLTRKRRSECAWLMECEGSWVSEAIYKDCSACCSMTNNLFPCHQLI